jgi:hypothetical protein
MRRWFAAVLALALLAVACGNDEHEAVGGNATEPTGTTPSSNGAALPGERQDIYPYEGAKLGVVGVAADDTLKVRSGPGTGFGVVFELRPTAMNATATGHNRSVKDAGFWSEIMLEGRTGWANTSFLLQPGEVNDITAALFPTPADRPTEKTMLELGQAVARVRAGDDSEAEIVVVDGPSVGDVGEITVDIVGVSDDSVGGERLKIFAEPGSRGDSFTVRSVEAMTFCRRGVIEGGLCV